jgi:putative peptidoglycan lipid II flippase
VVMGAVLYILAQRGAGHMAANVPVWEQVSVLGLLVVFGMVVYFTLIHFSGAQPMGQLLLRLRRSKQK